MTPRHSCPYCVCGVEPPLHVNPAAPFYALVVLIDRLTYERPRTKAAA